MLDKDLKELDTLHSGHALMEEIWGFAKEHGRLPHRGKHASYVERTSAERLKNARNQNLSLKSVIFNLASW